MRLGSHNTYLMIFGEAGVLFGIFFLLVLGRLIMTSLKCQSPLVKQLALGYLIILLLAFVVSHNELWRRYHNILLGLVFGLLAGRSHFYEKMRQREEGPYTRITHPVPPGRVPAPVPEPAPVS